MVISRSALPVFMSELRIFDHGPNGKFIRSGTCCRCGECCFGDPFEGERGIPEIEGACFLLTFANGKFSCKDRQDPYYLKGCNEFPSHPGQIADKPSCSYRFEEVISGG